MVRLGQDFLRLEVGMTSALIARLEAARRRVRRASIGSGFVWSRGLWAVVASIHVAVTGCATAQTGPSPVVPTGLWGGDHISMTVGETSSRVELDCAYGEIPTALTTDSRGTFSAVGTFVQERGGPIREDETLQVHPAIYVGAVTANTMRLTIRLTDPEVLVGTFVLTRGTLGRLVKCL
jgi:hypothetical protein